MPAWPDIDTVLLDMDGTLIDLRFDNTLWNQHLPALFAAVHDLKVEEAREHLYGHMRDAPPSLDFYSLDYWAAYTGMDIDGLHAELDHLIVYRPGASPFMAAVRASGRRAVLVTNAHPKSLAIKDGKIGLRRQLDADFSSHDFGMPKEDPGFWPAFAEREAYDPERTLLIDDNPTVLGAARGAGIRHLLCVTRPDSGRPHRADLGFPAFDHFDEIAPP